MRYLLAVLMVLVTRWPVSGAPLIVDRDSLVFEGGTYDRIEISGKKYITLRNVTVQNNAGTNDYAGILLSGAKYIDIDRCTINGMAGSGRGTCGAIKLDGASRVTIRNCDLYNCNDDGFRAIAASYIYIWDNKIHHLLGCGTDGGCSSCNNGHSDGIQVLGCIYLDLRRNIFYDIRGNAAIMVHADDAQQVSRNITIYNNLVYLPQTGMASYLFQTNGAKVYNNVIWGGVYGGLAIGQLLTNLEFYNNMVSSMQLYHMGGSFVSSTMQSDYNLYGQNLNQGWPILPHDIVNGSPGFRGIPKSGDLTGADFELTASSPAVNKGYDGGNVGPVDFYGNRPNGVRDMGGIEYNGVAGPGRVWFTASNREGNAPLNVTFNNTSPAAFTGWQWDFGDGGTATAKSPSHTYNAGGRHTVTLIGTGSAGNDTLAVRYYVVVTGGTGINTPTAANLLAGLYVFPDPMTYRTSFYLPSTVRPRIFIHDQRGNLVRHLDGVRTWDGRNQTGQLTGPGMYFYTVVADNNTATGKIVKLR